MDNWFKRAYARVHEQRFVLQVLIIALALVADQISKHIIVSTLTPKVPLPVIPGIFSLTYIQNTGASFGILQGKQTFFLIVTAITLAALLVYMISARKKQGLWLRVCLSLIVAGAAGNFIDRILFGFVRDFLDFSGLYFPFIFNVADSCLVVGSIMLGIFLLFMYKEKDGKPLLARRGKRDELLEGDEKLDDEDEEPKDAEGGKPADAEQEK
jgi:signal peptidase II